MANPRGTDDAGPADCPAARGTVPGRHRALPLADVAVAICLAVTVAKTAGILGRTGAVDFRNRVVAARVALAGHDPYVWKWSPGDPERLLDPCDGPHNKNHHYTRLTSPPTALLWIAPLAGLDYRTLTVVNFVVSWACVAASLLVLRRLIAAPARPVAAVFLCGFLLGMPLEYHMERGQQYTHFVLLWLLAAVAERAGRRPAATAALAVNSALRPPNAVGLLAARGPREALLHLGLAAAVAAGTLAIVPPGAWLSYLAATRSWFLYLSGGQRPLGGPPAGVPPVVEGDPTLTAFVHYGGPRSVVNDVLLAGLRLEHSAAAHWAVALGCSAVFVAFFIRLGRRPHVPELAALAWLVDLALPAPRCIYNDVLVLSFVPLLLAGLQPGHAPLAWALAGGAFGMSAGGRLALVELVYGAVIGSYAVFLWRERGRTGDPDAPGGNRC